MLFIVLIALGLAIGAFGALVGVGGGFILMPILVFWMPTAPPEVLTALSLAVVTLNAVSGTASYARMGRIDVRTGVTFALAGVPGAALGAWIVQIVPRAWFELLLGVTMSAMGVFLAWRTAAARDQPAPPADLRPPPPTAGRMIRGSLISFLVGVLSSLLGIGGGIIHVPAMVYLLGFSVHTSVATSLLVLASTGATATAVHAFDGTLVQVWREVIPLGIGVVIGAQLGARYSSRVKGPLIILVLAVTLALIGLRIAWSGMARLKAPELATPPASAPGSQGR